MIGYAMNRPIRVLGLALAVAATVAIFRCADTTETVRRVTYAKDLRYVDRKQIDAAMADLSRDVVALEALIGEKEAPPPEAQAEIVTLLASIEESAAALEGNGAFSNHATLDRNIESFRFDVQRAREAASRNPPTYLLASSVSSFCFQCHIRRSGRTLP
jgi:hypothetical protein